MKKQTKITVAGALATAAITGLFAGSAFATTGNVGISNHAAPSQVVGAGVSAFDTIFEHEGGDHSCKGQHDCKGHNECKGQGGCKSGDNGCKGKNSCKGKGGCASTGH